MGKAGKVSFDEDPQSIAHHLTKALKTKLTSHHVPYIPSCIPLNNHFCHTVLHPYQCTFVLILCLRSANYLQACSMHRYFAQMRNLAVVIMRKAYHGPRNTQFPLEDLIRLLAFEGENEVCLYM